MASPSPVTYSFKDLEDEINRIGTNESKSLLADIKKFLERNSPDNVRHLANKLLKEVQTKAGTGMSEDAQKFVCRLQATGSESDVTIESKTGTTIFHVDGQTGAESVMPQGNQAVRKGNGNLAKTVHEGRLDMLSEDQQAKIIRFENDVWRDVFEVVKLCLSSKDFDTSKSKSIPKNHDGLEILQGIIKLKEENKRISESNDNRIVSLENQLKESQQKVMQLEREKHTLQQTIEQLRKDKISVEDAYKTSVNDQMDRERNFNSYINDKDQENAKLASVNDQLQQTNGQLSDKLRKANKEIEGWKDQLQQLAEDSKRQIQKQNEDINRLQRENKELKSRVSELAGAKLMDNNPDIADLSDPNRALKLGEKFSSLYDDDWTDAYQTYTEKFNMKEDEAIYFLLQVLLKTYGFCQKVADEQMDCLCNVFENPCQDIPKALTMKPQKEKTQITQKQFKDLKDLRKQIGLRKASSITKQYVSKEYEEVKKGDKKSKSMLDETKSYYEKCVEVCWPMVLHDPPVRMEHPIKPGIKIDGNRFRLYGGNGDVLEYLVWPPLLVEGGGLLAKGVAKPKKTPRTVKKP